MRRLRALELQVSDVNAHRAALFADRDFQRALTRPPQRRYHVEDHDEVQFLEVVASELRDAFYRASTIARLDEIRARLLEIEAALSERALVNWNFARDVEEEGPREPQGWDALDELDAGDVSSA